MHDIANYAEKQAAQYAEICHALRTEIDAVLTKATSKIWHAIPVWFVEKLVAHKGLASSKSRPLQHRRVKIHPPDLPAFYLHI
jgi:hypothetical protein